METVAAAVASGYFLFSFAHLFVGKLVNFKARPFRFLFLFSRQFGFKLRAGVHTIGSASNHNSTKWRANYVHGEKERDAYLIVIC